MTVRTDVAGAPTVSAELQRGLMGGGGNSHGALQGGRIVIGRELSRSTKRGVAGHEFGHVMRLPNTSTPRELMNGEWDSSNRDVTKEQMDTALLKCSGSDKADTQSTQSAKDK